MPFSPTRFCRVLLPAIALCAACGLALLSAIWAATVQAAESPAYGDRIVIGSIGEATNLIPPLSSDSASSEISQHIFVSLLRFDKDLNLVPWAAESFEALDGGLTLRFILRPGILWEDGVELTAEDVAFTYRAMIDPRTPTAYGGDFRMVSSFTVLDRYTVEVRYDAPYARSLVTWASAILPRHLLEGTDLATTPYARKPVGAGPFRFQEWSPGSRVRLAANPGYFLGRPNLDGVVYTVIPDLTTMFLELAAHSLDMMGLTPQQYVFQADTPAIKDEYAVFRYPSRSYTYLGYNLTRPLFQDARVRRAFAHAIDTKEIITGALLDQGLPTVGPYVPGSWTYNDSLTPYAHDPGAALALLAEAGWTPGADGVLRNGNGEPFRFTILTNQGNEQRIKTAVIIQSQLARIGIQAEVRTVEWAVFLSRFLMAGRYDAVVMGWTVPVDPDLYDVWHSANIPSEERPYGLNMMYYKNAELDDIITRARSTFDRAERKRLYDRAQEILYQDQPYCFLYVPYALPAVHRRFQGIEAAPAGITWNFERWWAPPMQHRHVP